MISFAELIKEYKIHTPEIKVKSKRSELLKELYQYYEDDYKKWNIKIYKGWLKGKPHTQENLSLFKKSPLFYKKITIKSFCSFWLSHIPTEDLPYLVSIAKDKKHRKESFNKWLFWSLKANV